LKFSEELKYDIIQVKHKNYLLLCGVSDNDYMFRPFLI